MGASSRSLTSPTPPPALTLTLAPSIPSSLPSLSSLPPTPPSTSAIRATSPAYSAPPPDPSPPAAEGAERRSPLIPSSSSRTTSSSFSPAAPTSSLSWRAGRPSSVAAALATTSSGRASSSLSSSSPRTIQTATAPRRPPSPPSPTSRTSRSPRICLRRMRRSAPCARTPSKLGPRRSRCPASTSTTRTAYCPGSSSTTRARCADMSCPPMTRTTSSGGGRRLQPLWRWRLRHGIPAALVGRQQGGPRQKVTWPAPGRWRGGSGSRCRGRSGLLDRKRRLAVPGILVETITATMAAVRGMSGLSTGKRIWIERTWRMSSWGPHSAYSSTFTVSQPYTCSEIYLRLVQNNLFEHAFLFRLGGGVKACKDDGCFG